MRLTEAVRQQLLDLNDGFSQTSHYSDRNSDSTMLYTVKDGALHIRESGKTSWADSRYDNSYIADPEQTHRFLAKYRDELDWAGVDPMRTTGKTSVDPPVDEVMPDVVGDEAPDEALDEPQDSRTVDETAKEWAVLGVAVLIAGAGLAAYKYGRPIWNERVKPAASRLRDKIRRPRPDAPDATEEPPSA